MADTEQGDRPERGKAILAARPRVIAVLAVQFRDLDLAEDAFAEASETCLGLIDPPDSTAAWLLVASRRRALDMLRRKKAEARALDHADADAGLEDVIAFPEAIPDERLRLIFICCHPAIALEARVALALKVVCGVPVAEIARVFLSGEPAMFQRITRAKRKVREAGIAFELPPRKAWGERLEAVLLTLELAFTVSYGDASGERVTLDGGRLSEEVARLAAMLAELLPEEPEVLGFAALVWLARSREAARVGDDGAIVPLSRQDTALWDRDAIERARRWLDEAAAYRATGPRQLLGAIHLAHARRAFDGETDWHAIVTLYDALLALRPVPMVALSRAVAIGRAVDAATGLAALEAAGCEALEKSRPFHAARGDLLARAGQTAEAISALEKALALDPPNAERIYFEGRIAALVA